MTVTYSHQVADARFCGFSRLLGRWRGSIYKVFYKEFLLYISLYMLISIVYRFILDKEQREKFENLCLEFHQYTALIPVAFVLGFYVTIVVGRWWKQLILIPFPDRTMYMIVGNLHGTDSRGRMMRRTLMRYLNLSQMIVYQAISTSMRKRFPTTESFLRCGAMTKHEYVDYQSVNSKHLKYWIPLVWFSNLLSKAKMEGRIVGDIIYNQIMKEMMDYRTGLGMLLAYDWVTLPLVYTQVVTLAVYSYFASTLLGRQILSSTKDHHVDLVFPYFTICEFFFYMGLLKVAEVLINPFGEDDDDFNMNEIIDRNTEIPLLAVDNLYGKSPRLTRDEFWDVDNPEIPYAPNTQSRDPFTGSTVDMRESRQDIGGNKTRLMEPLIEQPVDENGNLQQKYHQHEFGDDLMMMGMTSFDDVTSGHHHHGDGDLLSNIMDTSLSDDVDVDDVICNDDVDDDDDETVDAHSSTDDNDVINEDGDQSESTNKPNNKEKSNPPKPKTEKAILNGQLNAATAMDMKAKTRTSQQQQLRHNNVTMGAGKVATRRMMTRNQRDHNLQKRIQLQIENFDNDNNSDRENVYKRMLLQQGRNKRSRAVVASASEANRMRLLLQNNHHKPSSKPSNKKHLLHRNLHLTAGSPTTDNQSMVESPFGSIASFATSVPSPKQLRWCFRPNRPPSISGNDSEVSSCLSFSQTSVTGPHSSGPHNNNGPYYNGPHARSSPPPSGRKRHVSESNTCDQQHPGSLQAGNPRTSTSYYHDQVLKRLQVVPKISRSQDSLNHQPMTSLNDDVDKSDVTVADEVRRRRQTSLNEPLKPLNSHRDDKDPLITPPGDKRSSIWDSLKWRLRHGGDDVALSDPEANFRPRPRIVVDDDDDVKMTSSLIEWEAETATKNDDVTTTPMTQRPDHLDLTTNGVDDVSTMTSRDDDVDDSNSFAKLDPIPENYVTTASAMNSGDHKVASPVIADPLVSTC